MRRVKAISKTLALAIAALPALTVSATALSFNFSFNNVANGGGSVTGVIRGLSNDATGPASSFEVLTNSDGFGIGEYIGNPSDNLFTVSNLQIVFADFEAFGIDNAPPAVTDSSIELCLDCNPIFPGVTGIGLTNVAFEINSSSTSAAGLTIAPVPVPASLGLALAGFGALGVFHRRRRRAA